MISLEIRRATRQTFAIAIEWAADEGWNPGLDDLRAFHAADPEGFLIGYADGEPVASISVVRYGSDFGFLGFYIVPPAHRGKGYGMQIWTAGLDHLAGRTVGLDGVVDQQSNYRKSGFEFSGRNVRFSGRATTTGVSGGASIHAITSDMLIDIATYDSVFFPADRAAFIADWAHPRTLAARTGLVATNGRQITGFCVMRKCREGYKIGPLFADDPVIAGDLFAATCARMEPGSALAIDVPEDNAPAVALARRAGLTPTFETARMYKGPAPALPLDRIFGITTFELG